MQEEEKILVECVGYSTAYQVLELGHLHNKDQMKIAAFAIIKKMFPGQDLPDSLMETPEAVKTLVDSYNQVQEVLTAAKRQKIADHKVIKKAQN
jgi:hypothetical protein